MIEVDASLRVRGPVASPAAGPWRQTGRRQPGGGQGSTAVLVAAMAFAVGACGTTPPTASLVSEGVSSPVVNSAASTAAGSSVTSGSRSPIDSLEPRPSRTSGLAWSTCTAPFECATLGVPIDNAHPADGSIELALIRLPATDPAARIGALVTDPGGPGGSGVRFVRAVGQTIFPAQLRARFDIIGFDPRGVGQSHPIECVDAATMDRLNALDPVPDTPGELSALADGARTFDAGCVAHSGPLLPFMSTVDAAEDLDQIRIALGDPKLTYLGFSYGTFLGSTYANLYPDRVRALVLDGAVDATLPFTALVEAQAQGFAAALARFLADCASRPACPFYNGGRPGPAYDALMARIDAAPLPAKSSGDVRQVGPGEALSGVVAALYSQSSWLILARALAQAQAGDGSLLLALADSLYERSPDGTYTNIAAASTAVNCADFAAPTDLATYDALAHRLGSLIPRFGEAAVYLSLNCVFWPFHPSHDPVAPVAAGAPPILVIGTTGDPATPYAWSVKLAKELSSGVLLTRTGEGHTAYGSSACIDSLVDAYLLTLAVPRAGTVCP